MRVGRVRAGREERCVSDGEGVCKEWMGAKFRIWSMGCCLDWMGVV